MYTTEQIKQLINSGEIWKFYNDWYWRKLSAQIMKEQNYECQHCKARGKYTRAKLVHHVRHLKDCPELAYARWQDEGRTKRQLVALCHNCHEAEHPDRFGKRAEHYSHEERW